MITISVSEGVAFDMYAIAEVKRDRTNGARPCVMQCSLLAVSMVSELDSLFLDVISSPEYKALYEANARVFDLIDHMHVSPTDDDGTTIDQANHQRYLAKVALQKRWFPKTPIGEVKIGYDAAPSTT